MMVRTNSPVDALTLTQADPDRVGRCLVWCRSTALKRARRTSHRHSLHFFVARFVLFFGLDLNCSITVSAVRMNSALGPLLPAVCRQTHRAVQPPSRPLSSALAPPSRQCMATQSSTYVTMTGSVLAISPYHVDMSEQCGAILSIHIAFRTLRMHVVIANLPSRRARRRCTGPVRLPRPGARCVGGALPARRRCRRFQPWANLYRAMRPAQ